MPGEPSAETYNTVWRLHCDPQHRTYALLIEYRSSHAPREHERLHARLVEMAQEWLRQRGLNPALTTISIARVSTCEQGQPVESVGVETDQKARLVREQPAE